MKHSQWGLKWAIVMAVLLFPFCALAQVPSESEQLILVVSSDWEAVSGQLQRFERKREGSWQPVSQPFDIVLGKKGLGWGRGVFDPAVRERYLSRKEGDKRAPAGVFTLGTAFGLASEQEASRWLTLRMPYLHLAQDIRCIGASDSRYYNQLLHLNAVKKDWANDRDNEYMRLDAIRDEGAYRWGVFVNHNTLDNPAPFTRDKISGSCIFLHIWKGPGIGTSGCTAMAKSNLLKLLNWLDASRHPVLVQLPLSEYKLLQSSWGLPKVGFTSEE